MEKIFSSMIRKGVDVERSEVIFCSLLLSGLPPFTFCVPAPPPPLSLITSSPSRSSCLPHFSHSILLSAETIVAEPFVCDDRSVQPRSCWFSGNISQSSAPEMLSFSAEIKIWATRKHLQFSSHFSPQTSIIRRFPAFLLTPRLSSSSSVFQGPLLLHPTLASLPRQHVLLPRYLLCPLLQMGSLLLCVETESRPLRNSPLFSSPQ